MASADASLPAVTYERTPGAASAPLPTGYLRREPEKGALYEIVQQNLETFLAEPLLHGAASYPRFVEHEFRRFLDCGQLSRGMVRYYGVFANRSKYRPRLPMTPEARALAAAAPQARTSADEGSPQLSLPLTDNASDADADADAEPTLDRFPTPRPRRSPWAVLLYRAFGIEALRCECGAAMTVLAVITAIRVLERILTHLGLPAQPPPIAPARLEDQLGLGFDGIDDVFPHDDSSSAALASARDPP